VSKQRSMPSAYIFQCDLETQLSAQIYLYENGPGLHRSTGAIGLPQTEI